MRSVIDEIATAEKQAEEIRALAAANARERTMKAREEARNALSELESKERVNALSQMETARAEGEKLSGELLVKLEQEADTLCERAHGRLDKAVLYIVDQVKKSV